MPDPSVLQSELVQYSRLGDEQAGKGQTVSSLTIRRAWGGAPETAAGFRAVLQRFDPTPEAFAWADGYIGAHAGRCRWDADFLATHGLKNCLNIGGSPFLFEYLLKQRCPSIEVVSIDLAPERFPRAEQTLGIRILPLNIEAVDPDISDLRGRFDCVVMCEVFEHLRINLLHTMSLVRAMLAPHGMLYLTTPNGVGTILRRYLRHGRRRQSIGAFSKAHADLTI